MKLQKKKFAVQVGMPVEILQNSDSIDATKNIDLKVVDNCHSETTTR
jgi:hypothetical protein